MTTLVTPVCTGKPIRADEFLAYGSWREPTCRGRVISAWWMHAITCAIGSLSLAPFKKGGRHLHGEDLWQADRRAGIAPYHAP